MKNSLHTVLVSAFLSTSTIVAADTAQSSDWNLSVGLASISTPSYLGDDNNRSVIAPDINATYKGRFFVSTLGGMGYNLINQNGWLAGPIVKYHAGRLEDGDEGYFVDNQVTKDLQGLGDISGTAEIGGFVEYSNRFINTRLEIRQGADGHKGAVGEASVQYIGSQSIAGKPLMYSVGPQVGFGDANYLDAFFGVDEQQSVRSDLSAYEIDGGLLSYGVRGSLILPVTNRVSIMGFGTYEVLSEDVADSSLVSSRGSDDQGSVGVILSMSF